MAGPLPGERKKALTQAANAMKLAIRENVPEPNADLLERVDALLGIALSRIGGGRGSR